VLCTYQTSASQSIQAETSNAERAKCSYRTRSRNAQIFVDEWSLPTHIRILVITRRYLLLTLLMGSWEWLSVLGLLLHSEGARGTIWLLLGLTARALKLSIVQAVSRRRGFANLAHTGSSSEASAALTDASPSPVSSWSVRDDASESRPEQVILCTRGAGREPPVVVASERRKPAVPLWLFGQSRPRPSPEYGQCRTTRAVR
jgi:hypothetical protein